MQTGDETSRHPLQALAGCLPLDLSDALGLEGLACAVSEEDSGGQANVWDIALKQVGEGEKKKKKKNEVNVREVQKGQMNHKKRQKKELSCKLFCCLF